MLFPTSLLLSLLVIGACLVALARGEDELEEEEEKYDLLVQNPDSPFTFGLINGESDFYTPIAEGWNQQCRELGVNCVILLSEGENQNCTFPREPLLREMVALGVDGVALKPCRNETLMKPIFDEVAAAGVPVVTFDADVPNLTRAHYVGTDNWFLGRTMARLLRQLRPEGGSYAIVGLKKERVEGFVEEITRYNDRDDRAHWHGVADFEALITAEGTGSRDWIDLLDDWASMNPTAILTMFQSPMRHVNWTQFVDRHRHRNITLIGVDGADYQLDYLNRRYVDGLIGQLPFEIGSESLQALYNIATNSTRRVTKDFIPTNLVSYNLIPLDLPPLDVDQNLLGNLKIVGYTCFALVAVTALACMVWTGYYRTSMVVRAAQPFFLAMVAGGILILISCLVPLSMDDGGDPDSMSNTRAVGICMSIPWLAFTGFTVAFSALFSKTWRVNRVFHAGKKNARMSVSVTDVIGPFAVLLTMNIVVLICWTVIDPLTYVREEHIGTDYWNRVISTYGACRSDNVVAYLVPLAVINFSVVVIATWQAVQARNIESEFSEAKYIGLAVFSLFQAFLTGIPVVVVVRNDPQAYYLVLTIMLFILCMAVLQLIFLPKINIQRKYAGLSEAEQKKLMKESVKKSSGLSSSEFFVANSSTGNNGSSSFGASNNAQRYSMSRPSVPSEEATPDSAHGSMEFQEQQQQQEVVDGMKEMPRQAVSELTVSEVEEKEHEEES